jgi:hypothetical protein
VNLRLKIYTIQREFLAKFSPEKAVFVQEVASDLAKDFQNRRALRSQLIDL